MDFKEGRTGLDLRGYHTAGGKSVRGDKLKLTVNANIAGHGFAPYLTFGCGVALHSGDPAPLLQARAGFW